MVPLLVMLLVSVALQAGGSWPALGVQLREFNVPVPADANADQQITSFSTLDDDRVFVIAYYDFVPDSLLHDLRVRAFDKRARTWRSQTFSDPIGSILSIEHVASLLYVVGHWSPSASPLLVLNEDLSLKRRLDGWPKLALPDGRVVFERTMVHSAPAHAAVLAVYDPATNRDHSFYPSGRKNDRGIEQVPGTDLLMDRSIGDVTNGKKPRTIEFAVTTERMRLESDNMGHDAGPRMQQRVTCDIRKPIPVCSEARD
jgi:hypothetical protein